MKNQVPNSDCGSHSLNDRAGFIRIYHQYAPKVFFFAYSMTKSREDAEEITSDVFVRIWQKKEIVDPSLPLLPLLKKITRDLTWNYLKRVARLKDQNFFIERYLNATAEDTADQLIFKEYQEIMNQALNKLTPQQRQVFSLRYITGKDLNQISEELQISKNTVKVHLAKSKRLILLSLPFNAV